MDFIECLNLGLLNLFRMLLYIYLVGVVKYRGVYVVLYILFICFFIYSNVIIGK